MRLEKIKAEKVHPDVWESEANSGFYDALNRGIGGQRVMWFFYQRVSFGKSRNDLSAFECVCE